MRRRVPVPDDPVVPALIGLGLSHRSAPLGIRERLALAPDDAGALLRALTAGGAVEEAVALSTCNRTELYVLAADAAAGPRAAASAPAGPPPPRPARAPA